MSDADRSIQQLQAVTEGYAVGPLTQRDELARALSQQRVTNPVVLPAPLTEERVRQIVREELDRLRPVFLPAPPPFRGEP
jgi:hypothetical protein